MMITAAQLYYITKVYPEKVTHVEALEVYERYIKTDDDKSYWDAAATVVNKITT